MAVELNPDDVPIRRRNRESFGNILPKGNPDEIIRRRSRLPVLTHEQKELKLEQQVAQCELLMIKGFQSNAEIMKLLGFDSLVYTQNIINRVLARWEITGQGRDLAKYRGEALGRVRILMQESFVALQNVTEQEDSNPEHRTNANVKHKVALIRTMAVLNKQFCDLNGLSAKNIARVMSPSSEGSDVVQKMRKQDQLVSVARKFLQVIKETQEEAEKTIEGELVSK